MSQQAIRPYEISLWTLQDSFITILKPIEGLFQGQVITPKISLKNDNTQTLTFSIPMYYRNDVGELVENPLWYNTINGNLLVNLRKIKVIFNKGEEGESVYEFIIHKITESHSGGQLICEVEAEGLAFQELGKIGYKITLNYDEFLLDAESNDEVLASLNYWADKVFKNTNWTYSIQMDWSSYDGIIDLDNNNKVIKYEFLSQNEKDTLNNNRESKGLRRRDKIYEEEYVSSWETNGSVLIPKETVSFQEKARIPQIEKSNIYNATQDLAELFEVYCKYKYYYDDNYHIIGRECIFYNNFLDEQAGKFDINYPYHTDEIKRTLESTDVITKMFVEPIEDVSIVDVSANRAREDYILNFDYLYSIGTITQEQYDSVEDYTYQMHILNKEYESYSKKINKYDLELVDLKANYKTFLNSITYDLEQIEMADDLLNAITDGDGILEKTKTAPEKVMILREDSDGEINYRVSLSLEGILVDKPIELYSEYNAPNGVNQQLNLSANNFVFDSTTESNLIGFTNLQQLNSNLESGFAYLVCSYNPKTKYENVKKTFTTRLEKDQAGLEKIKTRLDAIGVSYFENDFIFEENKDYSNTENELNKIQEEMKLARTDFERMMGPALREGSWTPEDDYSDSGDRYSTTLTFESRDGLAYAFWDSKLFEDEQNNYVEVGVEQNKNYYSAIDISLIYKQLVAKENELVLKITEGIDETYFKIGSQLQYSFLRKDKDIIPALLITEILTNEQLLSLKNSYFCTMQIGEDGSLNFVEDTTLPISLINSESYSIVYPRIEINSIDLKTTDDDITLKQGEVELVKYNHYTLLEREDKYYITIKPSVFIKSDDLMLEQYYLKYVISNASLLLYLDALEVSKINAYPQASYEVVVAALDKTFLKYSYDKLNKVANINDDELKFENVQGYISEIEMDLEQPWEDTFTIQNYKTKFEDLFSRIVASTEQMKTNQFAYDRAASAFTTNGVLNTSILQNTINSVDLKYSFNQGELTIDETEGIWAISDAGVVAMRGGGIFCATEKDSNNNWLWHSGITPTGINASLLQAGVIDTNLIRIYSGNNVRFQMNGEGLFAYAQKENGSSNFNKYVVHNSEGLFLTEKKENSNEKINLVEVSWDGLIIRDKEGTPVFYADEEGNLNLVGKISAQEGGYLAGWEIGHNTLTSSFLDPLTGKTYSAGLSTLDDPVLWVGQEEKENMGLPSFYVTKDGTLYASNAFINGIISANTVIGNLTSTGSTTLGDAVKQLNVLSISEGNSFKYSNPNLDGNIVLDPEWLRFQIRQSNINLSDWKFEIWDGSTLFKGENGEEIENWIPIEYGNGSTSNVSLYFENFKHLTFVVKHDIMYFEDEMHDFIYLRVSGTQEESELDEQGNSTENKIMKTYSDTFFLTNNYYATNKELSLIDPPSYTFIENQVESSETVKSFKVTLKNLTPEEGKWIIDGAIAETLSTISGTSDVTDEEITREDSSTILVPAENINNGKWYINDELVATGDIVMGTGDSINVNISYNEDQTIATVEIIIPASIVPDGGQIVLRYELGSASRTAFVFKIKNGTDILSTQIMSSNGNIFKNGNIETELTINLYEGRRLINSEDASVVYGYIWKRNGEVLQNIPEEERYYLNKRTIRVINNDFETKAIYTCEIYESQEEAEEEYLNRIPIS